MAFDPKELKKLADACRKAGIKSYKADGIEFTLTDEAPAPSPYKKRKAAKAPIETADEGQESPVDLDGWDSLSPEEQLFYSSRDPLFEGSEEDKH
jgi:hypothetical protein